METPMRRLWIPALACLLAACSQSPSPTPTTAPTTAPNAAAQRESVKASRDGHFSPAITAEDFAGYVQRLASDEFEGRKPGTIGERAATTYLIEQFQAMGLKPGNGASFLQDVPAIETTLLAGDQLALDIAAGGS